MNDEYNLFKYYRKRMVMPVSKDQEFVGLGDTQRVVTTGI